MSLFTPSPDWAGKDAFLIGGGPSLTSFDFNLLKGRCVIGCNDAFRLGPEICQICLFGDASFFHSQKWNLEKFQGKVITCAPTLKFLNLPWLSKMDRQRDGIHKGSTLGWNYSTGAAAINLAISMGATRIFLLGYDAGKVNGKTHWHNHRDKIIQDETYRRFIRGFHTVHQSLKHYPEVRVINVTDGTSQLPVFDRMNFTQFQAEVLV